MIVETLKPFWFYADRYIKTFSDTDHYLWRTQRAPELFEKIKNSLPDRYREKKNIGLFYAFSEQCIERELLSAFTLDESSCDSLYILKPETEVTIFNITGNQI